MKPEKLICGNFLSLEELFGDLQRIINEIQQFDPNGLTKHTVKYFKAAENIYSNFKENQSRELFNDLIDKIWISSIKLKKVEIPEIKELVKNYENTVNMAVLHIKTLGRKILT